MSKEAMTLALEALNNSVDLVVEDAYNAEKLYGNYPTRQEKVGGLKALAEDHKKAIKALEEALDKQDPPPMECKTDAEKIAYAFGWFKALELNPTQKPWVGLTNEEIVSLVNETNARIGTSFMMAFARTTEAKLKEKNT